MNHTPLFGGGKRRDLLRMYQGSRSLCVVDKESSGLASPRSPATKPKLPIDETGSGKGRPCR
jgi:hypothetical protein